jgi:propanol-preferring alcohol dehydrogenase
MMKAWHLHGVDYAGFGTTTADAIESVPSGVRIVQVGMSRLDATISTKAFEARGYRPLVSVP